MICGAEACNLGAMIHGAELKVHFLKSFQKGSTCENLSQKLKSKKKKDGRPGAIGIRAPAPRTCTRTRSPFGRAEAYRRDSGSACLERHGVVTPWCGVV
jgi:hypothetical protein